MKNNKKGFTLIELLVVIAIIGLLSTLAVVSLSSAREKARNAKRMSDLKQVSTAMELYSSDDATGLYPVVGVCGAAGIIAAADGLLICPSPHGLINSDGEVFLAAYPEDPTATTPYTYDLQGANGYCLEATLENNDDDYFVCMNGSCYGTDTACP